MRPHQIRLVGPWEWRPVMSGAENAVKPALTRCQLPFTPEFNTDSDAVSLHRGFHRPTGIDDRTLILVLLDFSGVAASTGRDSLAALIAVSLNGQSVPVMNSAPLRDSESVPQAEKMRMAFDISKLLKPFNDLHVVISASPHTSTSLDAACLEIYDSCA